MEQVYTLYSQLTSYSERKQIKLNKYDEFLSALSQISMAASKITVRDKGDLLQYTYHKEGESEPIGYYQIYKNGYQELTIRIYWRNPYQVDMTKKDTTIYGTNNHQFYSRFTDNETVIISFGGVEVELTVPQVKGVMDSLIQVRKS